MPKEIKLPVVTSDFESGTIESWNKKEGERIEKGEVLLSIETDKAVVEVESEHSGVLGKILLEAGTEDVEINAAIAILLEDGESISDLDGFTASVETSSGSESSSGPEPENQRAAIAETQSAVPEISSSAAPIHSEGRRFSSPSARRLAAETGVDLNTVVGRGPKGRILKADVELAAQSVSSSTPATSAVPSAGIGSYVAIPNNNMRKAIARRLTESKRDVPHFYLDIDCDMGKLLSLRKELNAKSSEGSDSYKLSVNDFIIKASAMALRDVPAANSSWTEKAIHQYQDVDISVAVATDGGLITPIVRQADTKGLATISQEVKALAVRARDGKLKPEEFQGGGFSISNLGMYGIKQFNAIINPPQACILAVGAVEDRAVVKGGIVVAATMMTCTLSVDHRAVDGAVGAQFLQALKGYLENPLDLKMLGGV